MTICMPNSLYVSNIAACECVLLSKIRVTLSYLFIYLFIYSEILVNIVTSVSMMTMKNICDSD